MREIVRCLNCGIKWMRVIAYYDGTLELTEDLQYDCPACKSNYYKREQEEEAKHG